MSAFEVCDTHIDVMVSAALEGTRYGPLSWYHDPREEIPGTQPGEMLPGHDDYPASLERARREVNAENAEQWGATLLAENRRSVNHRYAEDELEAPYTFTRYTGQLKPVALLNAISCYEYQSCEHPGWETSEAHGFCQALRHHAIQQLPGMDSAPCEVTDAAQVFTGALRVRRYSRA
jgi:hypothetical protein